jgi:simple sugar transport system substrate-binding protein
MMNRRTAMLAGTALAALLALPVAAQEAPTMGVVVKIGGIPWFNAMEAGIKEQAAAIGMEAEMIGPTSADPALQVRAIEDLIARGVDVIGVVPNDEAALEPVLQKARDAGILVVSHEGPGLQNVDWNFEMASATGFGETHAELLAQKVGGEGEYAVFVGSLTVPLHNAWADAAIAYLQANYPNMTLVGERYGVAENVDDSRRTALDLMSANPNLKGFRGAPGGGQRPRHRAVLAGAGARPDPFGRHLRRLHVEPDGGRQGLRDHRRHARGRHRDRRGDRDPGPGRGLARRREP